MVNDVEDSIKCIFSAIYHLCLSVLFVCLFYSIQISLWFSHGPIKLDLVKADVWRDDGRTETGRQREGQRSDDPRATGLV